MIKFNGRVVGQVEMIAAFGQLPSLFKQGAERAMRESLEMVSSVARSKYLSGPYPTYLQPRTGRHRASLRRGDKDNIFSVASQGTTVTGVLGTKAVGARIHELGGVIRPTRGQYLTIPTAQAKTPSGVLKPEYSRGLRSIPGLYFQRTRSGVLYAAQRDPARGRTRSSRIRILFWLARQVKIPARPYLNPSLNESRAAITERFQVMANTIIQRTNETLQKLRRAS
jgi:phage gpG-like protein